MVKWFVKLLKVLDPHRCHAEGDVVMDFLIQGNPHPSYFPFEQSEAFGTQFVSGSTAPGNHFR